MADYQRVVRQQAIREAEGYLDLAMGFEEPWPVDRLRVDRLALRALAALDRVNPTHGQRAHFLYLRGQAYRVMQQYNEAIVPLTIAAALDPESIAVWLALAWCEKRASRLDRAIESLENALLAEPNEAILHYNLACYWSLAGNADLAVKYLAQSLELDPSYRDLVAEETDFDPIRDLPDLQALMTVVV